MACTCPTWTDSCLGMPRDLADPVDVPTLLKNADVIVCLAAYTADTENLIDRQSLATMKSVALLINASHAGLVDEEALDQALQTVAQVRKRLNGS